MTLAVIGAGFGRTGTRSLKLALEQLGFGPCCHGSEERHFRQGTEFWDRIFRGEPIDWDKFLDGYRSAVDSPSCKLYRELADKYPAAKVILTLRDPDRWFESFEETILPMISSPQGRKHFALLFGGRPPERGAMIAAFEQHNAEVQRLIPPERLLVYEVESGWPPLCRFLDVPVPDAPFPKSNSRADFASTIDGMLARM